jgi:DDE superfamily endonuclease
VLPVLQHALADLGLAPEREASRVAESPLALEGASELAIDGSERRRQRPQDAVAQKAHYGGKKKTHTDKNILVVNGHTRKLAYLGPTLADKTHDKKAADEVSLTYPLNATLDKDTGFQGYEPGGVLTRQPKKKPRGQELSVTDRWLNRLFVGGRVVVEHVIAEVKRCRIVKEVLRLTKDGISDLMMEIARLAPVRERAATPQAHYNWAITQPDRLIGYFLLKRLRYLMYRTETWLQVASYRSCCLFLCFVR